MFSLAVMVTLAGLTLLAEAAAMAVAARAVGARRGRLGPALACVGVLFVVGLAAAAGHAAAADQLFGTAGPPPVRPTLNPDGQDDARLAALQQVGLAAAFGLLELAVAYAVVRRAFALSAGRAFAPFGAYLGVAAVTLGIAVVVVRPHLIEAFVIPTGSMSPTLQPHDRVTVAKWPARPRRFDVVAYHNPADGNVYCKRLVGLPGETLVFDGHGGLTIDGRPLPLPPVLAGRLQPGLPRSRRRYAAGESIRLGDRQYFFIGDNVDLSYDSRSTGPTDASALIGVADLIYWPPARVRLLR